MEHKTITGDCLEVMQGMESNSVDLVFTSPPYEDRRKYGELQFALEGQAWAEWCAERFVSSLALCNGPVLWVVGHGKRGSINKWSAAPALLIAELHKRSVHLLRPVYYKRHGVFGGGQGQWFCPKVEWIVCATSAPKGRLPYAKVADELGHPPKFSAGGPPTHRKEDGTRGHGSRSTERRKDGTLKRRIYKPPAKANPGDVFDCGAVGGGHMGSELACENEAPFPEKLVEPFIRAFCPPGGTVLDPFGGSGTVAAVCERLGRNSISIDIRASQTELQRRRIEEAKSKV